MNRNKTFLTRFYRRKLLRIFYIFINLCNISPAKWLKGSGVNNIGEIEITEMGLKLKLLKT